ncbi:methyltransferase domain-containing protein [Amycolatopsis sp. NPDC003676]
MTTERVFEHERAAAYDASSIVIFSGLSAVRRNPSMYVGSTGAEGLHQLVSELVDNAVDECTAGYCRNLSVILHEDGSCTVEDDGRGIPVDSHPRTGKPACEVVLTTLHSGGKFGGVTYRETAGLHGVGLSCVNALSEWLRLDIWRDGAHHRQRFSRGEPVQPLTVGGPSAKRGTRIRFRPDPGIFRDPVLSAEAVERRLAEIAFLHPDLSVGLTDERTGETQVIRNTGGVRGFVEHLNRDETTVHPEPVTVAGRNAEWEFEVAFQWTEGYAEQIRSFVNTVATDQGGSHVDGLRAALASAVTGFAAECGMLDTASGETVTTMDVLEGLCAVLAVRMRDPKFDGQTKKRLQSPEAFQFVRDGAQRGLAARLAADESLGRTVAGRVLDATRARLAARLAGRTARFQQRELKIDYDVYRRQFGIRSRDWHDSCSWITDEGLLAAHAKLYDVEPDSRMLDVCCGSGVVGDAFRGKAGETVGLDITPEMVKLAAQRLDRVRLGTVYDLPFQDGEFDIVVNREVLHLLPRPEQPLAEIHRVLRPGGQFVVGQIMPYSDVDAFWMYRIFKKKQPLLFQMFREQDFRQLLLDAGFVDLRMEEYFLVESIDKWIDTHETTAANRLEIYRLFYEAPLEVRQAHPFEVLPDGSVRDQWRWCVYSARKRG